MTKDEKRQQNNIKVLVSELHNITECCEMICGLRARDERINKDLMPDPLSLKLLMVGLERLIEDRMTPNWGILTPLERTIEMSYDRIRECYLKVRKGMNYIDHRLDEVHKVIIDHNSKLGLSDD